MNESLSSERTVRTIRLDDEQVGKILDRMDAAQANSGTNQKEQRYPYRMKAVMVHMQQPGSTITVPYLSPTRTISEKGLVLLHGGFVHNDTNVVVQLITSYGTWDDVPGRVVSCRYVEANIHEVSIGFDRSIDPSIYCTAAVHSRILLVEDDPFIARLAKFHLEQLNAEVELAANGLEGVEKAMKGMYDVILMDMEMPVMDGFAAVKELRAKGYTGTIVATTALTQKDDAKRCIEVGCDKYLAKPHRAETLAGVLQSLREEPLISTLYQDSSMSGMIDEYVSGLPTQIRAIEAALVKEDAALLLKLVRTLKAQGASFGFGIITESAEEIEKRLIAEEPISAIRPKLSSLTKLCLQARSSCKQQEE